MKYIALLRGINAGKNKRVEMKRLKALFESVECANVSTYINSGNVIFESSKSKDVIQRAIELILKKEFGFEIPLIIKTKNEMAKISHAIPNNWQNDAKQRTDVAYLFDKIDSKKIIDKLPINREFIDIRYFKGAVFWNVDRKKYNKSHLNKIISHDLYQYMTVRNVNTARFLGNLK
jgi:uncharacterized protein (DUF1697 family)